MGFIFKKPGGALQGPYPEFAVPDVMTVIPEGNVSFVIGFKIHPFAEPGITAVEQQLPTSAST